MRRHWQVWKGDNLEVVLCEGSKAVCLAFLKQKAGRKWYCKGFHLGYLL